MNEQTKEAGFIGPHRIVYETVVKTESLLPSTRKLARTVIDTGYTSVAEYIRNLPDQDLDILLASSEERAGAAVAELLLISEILATVEGCEPASTIDQYESRMSLLTMFLGIEGLYRENLVDIFYENMSFGDGYLQKVVARKKRDEF